jgi:hypothetical protein
MYKIQNLTKRPIKFQGITIMPYASATIPQINDFIALSRFTNSGKIFYTPIDNRQTTSINDTVLDESKEKNVVVDKAPEISDVEKPVEIVEDNNKEDITIEKQFTKSNKRQNKKQRLVEDTKTED